MKKSNSLMLAYFIFLIITVIASLFSWDGISSMACGATIAGCLFSFADLTNRYSSYYKKFIEPYKEDAEVQRERALLFKNSLNAQIEDANKAIEILKPHCKDEKISQVILGAEKYINETNDTLLEVDSIANDTFIIEGIMAMENSVKQLDKRETKLLIAGYVLFFCIVVFDCLEGLFEPFLSALTVFAFALIVVNYLLHDILESKAEESIADIKERTRDNAERMQSMHTKAAEPSIVEKAKELVEACISLKKEEGMNSNGQTKNAQHE